MAYYQNPLDATTLPAWQALREGRALLLMRHATAPGTGDPANFRLGQCETQRNLNAQGRAEARRWGELLARQGIEQPRLLSSRWCRALDTASNMQRGPVQPFAALDSFFGKPADGAGQTAELIRAINLLPPGEPRWPTLLDFLAGRLAGGATVYPPEPLRALALTPPDAVRVVEASAQPAGKP